MRSVTRALFRLTGWRVTGGPPARRRFVLIAAPHTSNWDAVIMLGAARLFEIEISWLIKDTWFFFPLGTLLRKVGGIPVDRGAPRGLVQQAIDRFARQDELILVVPPEGTRGKTAHWKSGFYHIAHGAGVPIVLGYIDYAKKVAHLGPTFTTTGDIKADFEVFREFYEKAQVTARYPDKVGAVLPPPEREKERVAR